MSVWSQAPSDRQLRYKEKVTELRRKRNSGLNKEQKDKHVVSACEMKSVWCLAHRRMFARTYFESPPTISLLAGAPSEPRSEQGAAAGEHHQRLRPRAVQESAGTCLGGPCKRESIITSPPYSFLPLPFIFCPPPPTLFCILFLFFSVSVRKPSSAATGGV